VFFLSTEGNRKQGQYDFFDAASKSNCLFVPIMNAFREASPCVLINAQDKPRSGNAQVARRYSALVTMIYSRLQNRGRLVCALLATTLLLPALAFADHDNGKGNKGEKDDKGDNGKGKDRGDKVIPVVPEANAGWVSVPFFGAVLLFSSRRVFEYQTWLKNNGNPVHATTRLRPALLFQESLKLDPDIESRRFSAGDLIVGPLLQHSQEPRRFLAQDRVQPPARYRSGSA